MTTLDQAFIKAFSRQSAVPLPPSSQETPPAEKEPPRPLGVGRSEADRVLAALEQPQIFDAQHGQPRSGIALPQTSSNNSMQGNECQISTLPQLDFDNQQTVVSTSPWSFDSRLWNNAVESCCTDMPVTTPTIQPETVCVESESVVAPLVLSEPSPAPSIATPPTAAPVSQEPVSQEVPPAPPTPTPPVYQEEPSMPSAETPPAPATTPPAPQATPPATATTRPSDTTPAPLESSPALSFKPAWQVDRFTWPKVCRRLIGRAAEELDRLADALLAAHSSGHKVVAMAGWRQGEGATTLLLCAARRLAERGIKAVLVDADQNRPRLAKRLGVQPQLGWNEVAGDDPSELSQAVVEAAANNLAIAPLNEPSAQSGRAATDWSQFGPFLETLADHYEMVLVDPGPLANPHSVLDAPRNTNTGPIDAILLVRNQRISSDPDLNQAEQRLDAAGVAVIGVIENFVVS